MQAEIQWWDQILNQRPDEWSYWLYKIKKKLYQATGKPGHSVTNMQITILEKMKTNKTQYRKERKNIFVVFLTHSTVE